MKESILLQDDYCSFCSGLKRGLSNNQIVLGMSSVPDSFLKLYNFLDDKQILRSVIKKEPSN